MATPKKTQSIALKGIVRNTPDEATEDGGLLEAINVRNKDGAWRGVTDKLYTGFQTQQADRFTPPYYHPVLPDNTYVLHNITDNTIDTILFHGSTNNTPVVQLTLAVGEVFDRFSHLNNTLLVFTDVKKYSLYWNKDTGLYVDLSFLPKPILRVADLADPETNEVLAVGDRLDLSDPPDYGYNPLLNGFEYVRQNIVSDYLKKKVEENKLNHEEGIVLLRVAYKLFDGSYVLASQPILHHIGYHPTKVPTLSLTNFATTFYDSDLIQNYFSNLVVYYNFFNTGAFTLPDHDLMGIVESLDIFSTRLVESFDYNAPIPEWSIVSGTLYSTVFSPPFNTESLKQIIEDGQYYKVHSIPVKDIIAQQQHNDTSGLYLAAKAGYVLPDYTKEVATNELLPPDNFTHHEYNSLADYTYNTRIHLGNIIATLSPSLDNTFIGTFLKTIGPSYNGYAQTQDTFNTTDIRDKFLGLYVTPTGLADSAKKLYCQVWLNTDEGRKVVTTELQQDFVQTFDAHNIPATFRYYVYNDGTNNALILNPVLSYPDYRAYKMRYFYIYSGTKYFLADYDLKPNTALNTASYFSPLVTNDGSTGNHYPIIIPIPATTGTSMPTDDPATDDILNDSNRVQVSEQSNPYYWPTQNSYRFGLQDNKVIGIAGVQSAMSDSAFGQYPLYIFSKSGIYAMQTGNGEVLYASIQHLNNEVLLKRYSLVSITGAIIFAAKEGVRILQGGSVSELSIPAEGSIINPLISDLSFLDAISGNNLPEVVNFLSNIQFSAFIADCIMLFDTETRELVISAPKLSERYSYVLSFYTKVWTTRTEVFIGSMIVDGRMIGIKQKLIENPPLPDDGLSYTGEFIDSAVAIELHTGALYNHYAVTDPRGLCAAGAHIPTKTEFNALVTALGGSLVAGGKMKEKGFVYWVAPNTGADNSSGFNGKGSGARSSINGEFVTIRGNCYLWAESLSGAYGEKLMFSYPTAASSTIGSHSRKEGFAVRAVMDSTALAEGEMGTYTGNDGKVYQTKCIGGVEWMVEDLRETQWRSKYGALYNWYDIANVARNGFEVPSSAQLQALSNYLGGNSVAGGHLKEDGTIYWNTDNADNSSGFSARGAGIRTISPSGFYYIKGVNVIWAIDEYILGSPYHLILSNSNTTATVFYNRPSKSGHSIRPIKTTPTLADLLKADGEACDAYFDGEYYYRTVKIGTQVWVADNIKTRYYSDGSPIPVVTNNAAWAALGDNLVITDITNGSWNTFTTDVQIYAEMFVLSEDKYISGIELKAGSIHNIPNFNIRVSLYNQSGGLPTTKIEDSINVISAEDFTSDVLNKTFSFNNIYLSSGSYCFVISYEDVVLNDIDNHVSIKLNNSNPYPDGVLLYKTGSLGWTAIAGWDISSIILFHHGAMCYYDNDINNAGNDIISVETDNTLWTQATTSKMCWYNNDPNYTYTPDSTFTCQLVNTSGTWQNNGIKRSMTVLVRKWLTVGAVVTEIVTGGFPAIMDGKLAFPGYAAISQIDFDKLSDTAFIIRLMAFKSYLESLYDPFSCTWADATVEDLTQCPIPVAPVTLSIQNLNEISSDVKEFDVVVSDGSTVTIPYYMFVERNGDSKKAILQADGDLIRVLIAFAGSMSNYLSGIITIPGSVTIKINVYGLPNTTTGITDVDGFIRFDDNINLIVPASFYSEP